MGLASFARCKKPIFVVASLGLLGSAIAADEDIFFSELPIVASVSRLPQRLADAPTAVTVLDREIIKSSGARDLNDILRLVPGFQTFPHNTESARVNYHGLNDEEYSPRVQVLIDGQSQYSPLFRSGVNWLTIPVAIEDIERIEVVRGTNNVSYGNNSFLGVINIITVDPSLTGAASVSVSRGNQGVSDYFLRTGGKIGEAGHFRLTYQQKDDDGLTNRSNWRDFNSTRLIDARANLHLSNRDTLEINGGRSEGTTNLGRLMESRGVVIGGDSPENPMRDYDQSTTYLQFKWRRVLNSDTEFSLRYGFKEDRASEKHIEQFAYNASYPFYDLAGTRIGVLAEVNTLGGRSRTHELEAQHNFRAYEGIRISWGGGWRWDSLDTPSSFYGKSDVERDVGRLFGSLEWKPASWLTGNAGLSIDRDSLGGTHSSPRISANFHLSPENTIRLGYAIAYRTGSIHDYIGDRRIVPYATLSGAPIDEGSVYRRRYYGDENLAAEKLESIELGYLGDWKSRRMSLDVRLFHEKIPNRLMQLDRRLLKCPGNDLCEDRFSGSAPASWVTNFTTTMPIQHVETTGLEYQLRWQPLEMTRLMLSQAYIKTDAELLPDIDEKGNLINTNESLPDLSSQNRRDLIQQLTERSAPRHSTSVMWMQKLPYGFEFSAIGYWVGHHKWSRNTEVLGYERYDGRLGYRFRTGGIGGELAYIAQSINGAHGEYKAGQNDPFARLVERRQWVTLRLDL